VLTEKLQEEILTRAGNTLASLARVALEVLGVQDMAAYATARRLNPTLVYDVPNFVFSKEVVKFVAGSLNTKPSLVVRGFSLANSLVWLLLSPPCGGVTVVPLLLAAPLHNVLERPGSAVLRK
jgi:hypothetical protein